MNVFYGEIAEGIVKIIVAILGIIVTSVIVPWLKSDVIPWMQEKQIYGLVQRFVHAAEKVGETCGLSGADKKAYVISLLEKSGHHVNDEIDAFIESAVKEMDMAFGEYVEAVIDALDEEDDDYDEATCADGDAEG